MKKTMIILSLLLALVLLASCSSGQKPESEQKTGRFFNLDTENITGITLRNFQNGKDLQYGNASTDKLSWLAEKLNTLVYSYSKTIPASDEIKDPGSGPNWKIRVASMIPDGDHNYKSEVVECYFYYDCFEIRHADGSKTLYTLDDASISIAQEINSLIFQ